MGRWSYSDKQEADSLKQISISFLKKQGFLDDGYKSGTITWSRSGEQVGNITMISSVGECECYIKLIYTRTDRYSGEKKDFDYKIPLTSTPCYFGGRRYWFICPWYKNGRYCGRRVGTIYLGGDVFACRHCYDLTYESKKENRKGRHYPLFAVLDGYHKIEELEKQIRVKYYRGKPTRKQRRLDMLYLRMFPYMAVVNKMRP